MFLDRTAEKFGADWRKAFLLPLLLSLPCSSLAGVGTRGFRSLPFSGARARPFPVFALPGPWAWPWPPPLWGPAVRSKNTVWFTVRRARERVAPVTGCLSNLERDRECVLERVPLVFFSSDSNVSSSTVSCPSSRSMSCTKHKHKTLPGQLYNPSSLSVWKD